MANAIHLKLPNPSSELIAAVREHVNSCKVDTHEKYGLEDPTERYGIDKNLAYARFIPNKLIDKMISDEFSKFFKPRRIVGYGGGIVNSLTDKVAFLLPHIDANRSVVLNFVVDCGGPQVSTVFYDKSREVIGHHSTFKFSYNELLPVDTYILKNKWYALNTSRVHSVENIESNRILISLKIVRSVIGYSDHSYSMENLIQDYPELIGPDVAPIKPSTTVP